MIALTQELQKLGIVVNPVGTGAHVPKIQEVKERCRSILATLPYRLAFNLLAFLVIFAISRINMVPHRAGFANVSPTEAFSGRKVNYRRDLRIGFGEYAEAHDPYADNTMRPRTSPVICLGSTGNVSGSVRFLSLDSGRVITRDQFQVLPMSKLVIDKMNDMADAASVKLKYLQVDPSLFETDAPPTVDDLSLYDDPTVTIRPRLSSIDLWDVVNLESPSPGDSILRGDPPPNLIPTHHDSSISTIDEIYQVPDTIPDLESPLRGAVEQAPTPVAPVSVPVPHPMTTRSRTKKTFHSKIYNISMKKALKHLPDAAINSIIKELSQLIEKNVFIPVTPGTALNKLVIQSFMFLKEKFLSSGLFDKLKSRMVAGGDQQDISELLFEDINSPTVALVHLLIIAAIAARERRIVKTFDITGAYLNADISHRDIYMSLDPVVSAFLIVLDPSYEQYLRPNGTIIVKLLKALYGCVESAKLWYNLLSSVLVEDGFIFNPLDPCIMNKTINGQQITVVIYVDDILVTSVSSQAINDFEQLLRNKFHEISTYDGKTHSYLGMTFDFSTLNKVTLTMEGYIADLLKVANVQGKVKTPAQEYLFEIRNSPPLSVEAKATFHTMVAKLLYLAKRTRPDILLAVSFLTTRVISPDEDDQAKLHRVIKYLNAFPDVGITLIANAPASVFAYVDASYGVHQDGKSHSGLSITLGSGPIMIKSSKQKIVTKSSTEAELVAESDFASEALACKDFLHCQGEDTGVATIFQDNQSTIAMIDNGCSRSDRTRHINIRYFWTKEQVSEGRLAIVYISTDDMIADILTKPLQGEKFLKLRQLLMNY
jgi:hypothetical protein